MSRKQLTVPFELKKLEDGGNFEGYASVFGIQDFDGDVIVKGAFKRALEDFHQNNKKPKMLWQHNPTAIIGKWTDMFEDDKGLYVRGTVFTDIPKGAEAYTLMKHGELDGLSVGFNILDSDVTAEVRGRVISDLELWEISVVTWGANPEALISSVKGIKTERDFEQFLRDSGFSRKQAKAITAKGFKFGGKPNDEEKELEGQREAELIKSLEATIKILRGK